jgi:hypothetical protein
MRSSNGGPPVASVGDNIVIAPRRDGVARTNAHIILHPFILTVLRLKFDQQRGRRLRVITRVRGAADDGTYGSRDTIYALSNTVSLYGIPTVALCVSPRANVEGLQC